MSPGEILRLLRDELKTAQQRREVASEHFDQTILEVPTGIPYPDNVQRILRASHEYTRTQEEMLMAVKRLNDYLSHGIVPPHLETQQRKPAGNEASMDDDLDSSSK
jgi:hypothetical protein